MTKHDLVESLRDHARGAATAATRQQETHTPPEIFVEWKAADEIEKLRAEIARITDHVAGTLLPKINAQREVVERVQGEKSAWETLCKELEATVFKARGTLAVVEAVRGFFQSTYPHEILALLSEQNLQSVHDALNELDNLPSPVTNGLHAASLWLYDDAKARQRGENLDGSVRRETVPERTSIVDAKPLTLSASEVEELLGHPSICND